MKEGLDKSRSGTSLAVQWLRLHAIPAEGMGSIPGGRTRSPHATWWGQKLKKRKEERRSNFIISEDWGGEYYVFWIFFPSDKPP